MNPADCRRILIIKLSSIGDVVMATPVAKALRTALPDAYLAWVVEEKSRDVVAGNPYLDDVVVWERNSCPPGGAYVRGRHFVRTLREITHELRTRRFDVAIDLQGLLRSALVGWMSGAPYRLGYSDAREGGTLLYNMVLPSTDCRIRGPLKYLAVLRLLGIEADDVPLHMSVSEEAVVFARRFLEPIVGADGREFVALCPATTWPNKHWTEEGWAAVSDCFSAHGLLPLFLGGPADAEHVDRIIGKTRLGAESAVGKTSLNEAAAIIQASRLLIGVDTGLLHIAVALDKPVVGVFGPSGWQHFTTKDNFISVAKDFPCIPCFRHPTCKDYDCMRAITPDDVLRAADRWLGKPSVSREACRSLDSEANVVSDGG